MERDGNRNNYRPGYCHFNSHAHVERDLEDIDLARLSQISTHTLTWSVTGKTYAVCEQEINFNSHAHVERDQSTKIYFVYCINFNSHAHVERDIPLTKLW